MKSINLLPQSEKNIAQLRFLGGVLRFWSSWAVVLTLFAVVAVVVVGIVVRFQEQTFSQQVEALFSQQLLRDIVQSEEGVTDANERLLKAQSILRGRDAFHLLLIEITTILPVGVTIETLVYNQADRELRIGGDAPFRTDVLFIENTLEASDLVESIESPVSNILEATDVEFFFTVLLK